MSQGRGVISHGIAGVNHPPPSSNQRYTLNHPFGINGQQSQFGQQFFYIIFIVIVIMSTPPYLNVGVQLPQKFCCFSAVLIQ